MDEFNVFCLCSKNVKNPDVWANNHDDDNDVAIVSPTRRNEYQRVYLCFPDFRN